MTSFWSNHKKSVQFYSDCISILSILASSHCCLNPFKLLQNQNHLIAQAKIIINKWCYNPRTKMSTNLDQNRVLEHRDEQKSWTKAKTKQKKTQTATVMLNQDTLILLAMHTDTLNIFLFLFVLSLSLLHHYHQSRDCPHPKTKTKPFSVTNPPQCLHCLVSLCGGVFVYKLLCLRRERIRK